MTCRALGLVRLRWLDQAGAALPADRVVGDDPGDDHADHHGLAAPGAPGGDVTSKPSTTKRNPARVDETIQRLAPCYFARMAHRESGGVPPEERELLRMLAANEEIGERTRARVKAVVAFLDGGDLKRVVAESGLALGTARKIVKLYQKGGWQALISVPVPRGGDFLARYDNGFWAERLTRVVLDRSTSARAIPYGTSRGEPFTDTETFRKYAINEALLQAWSGGHHWKRPDLILVPRAYLIKSAGNDEWTPDLIHWDDARCREYLEVATAAIEVETSLWQVKIATVSLSFTIKEEDLIPLRNWIRGNKPPLYVVQVFYDQAFALPFAKLETLIAEGKIKAIPDRFTEKPTYNVPLAEGVLLGDIPEPEVEGRVYKAPNGRVTVYGRLTGSHIEPADTALLERLVRGQL